MPVGRGIASCEYPPPDMRRDDIVPLANHFLTRCAREHGRTVRGFSAEAQAILKQYAWPGNARELRNLVERIVLLDAPTEIGAEHLRAIRTLDAAEPAPAAAEREIDMSVLDAAERTLILDALRRAGNNRSKAARILNITRDTLRYRLKKYGIEVPD